MNIRNFGFTVFVTLTAFLMSITDANALGPAKVTYHAFMESSILIFPFGSDHRLPRPRQSVLC